MEDYCKKNWRDETPSEISLGTLKIMVKIRKMLK